jgi:FkbM family methyltransferase
MTSLAKAICPDWQGTLELSQKDFRTTRPGDGMGGVFWRNDDLLKIDWDDGRSDFLRREPNGVFFRSPPPPDDINSVGLLRIGPAMARATRIALAIFDGAREISLRLNTSDMPTYLQIFHHREYEHPDLPEQAQTIVDLGANIGCATLFFAQKYPEAKILAVEPEESNFLALRGNIIGLENRISARFGAAWIEDGEINLRKSDDEGGDLGAWGYQVSQAAAADGAKTPCWRVGTLYRFCGFDRVDILKVDIEGAELELFSSKPKGWLARTELIIIETHDRFRPGSDQAVRHALKKDFEELPPCGENLYFRRKIRPKATAKPQAPLP